MVPTTFRKILVISCLIISSFLVCFDVFFSQAFIHRIPSVFASALTSHDNAEDDYALRYVNANESDVQALYGLRNSSASNVTVAVDAGAGSFQSPFVVVPHVYTTPPIGSKSSSGGKKKISPTEAIRRNFTVVSAYNAPGWFQTHNLNTYNRGLEACPVKECYIDMAGDLKAIADVVLFFPGGFKKVPKRQPGQIWAFGSWESPEHYGYPSPYSAWKNQFNWTFSYRTDADWFFPNNLLTWRDPKTLLKKSEYVAIAKQKTKMVAWWVSHCGTKSAREKYVKEMQKYISVDIYGRCGKLSCSKTNIDKCEKLLTTTYRFYLSFENSMCRDYVSEKFFRMFAYRTHIVPVGRGGFDYNKYVPGNFVVDAADFKSAKALALHLKVLANDTPRYAKMLQEKDKLLALNRKMDWCDVCERLRKGDHKKHIYPDIRQWSHDQGKCRKPTDIL